MVEICRRFDGIPLAIELAASRMQSMTVTELRDRLDDRFRLLVGSRRGWSATKHCVMRSQWSHDLLDDTEKALLARCSVFGGGFDLAAAYAVGGCGDDLATLDVLDALVRKSFLVADRSSGRTRFSMLETIRQFAEEQLVASGAATEARTAHARYFAGKEADMTVLWDSPRQPEAYPWFTVELADLRTAFRWAVDHGDLDVATPIATYAAWLGFPTENYEPIAWAEELIEPARAVAHRRLTALYVMASKCYTAGRNDPAIRYTEAAQRAISSGSDPSRTVRKASLAVSTLRSASRNGGFSAVALSSLAVATPTRSPATSLVIGLSITGSADEAMDAANGLIDAAEATGNPSRCHGRCSATAWPAMTPTLSARSRPCAVAW